MSRIRLVLTDLDGTVVQPDANTASDEVMNAIREAEEIDLSAIKDETLSIWASVPAEKADEIAEDLMTLPDVAVHTNAGPGGDFSRTGIQVNHIEADKEHAIGELLKLTHTDKEHTLGIGDGNNDRPLFKGANLKIAMGNASDLLMSEADEVVATISDDGFAEAMRRFTAG